MKIGWVTCEWITKVALAMFVGITVRPLSNGVILILLYIIAGFAEEKARTLY